MKTWPKVKRFYALILELINRLIYIKQSVSLENELLAMLPALSKDLEIKQDLTVILRDSMLLMKSDHPVFFKLKPPRA